MLPEQVYATFLQRVGWRLVRWIKNNPPDGSNSYFQAEHVRSVFKLSYILVTLLVHPSAESEIMASSGKPSTATRVSDSQP